MSNTSKGRASKGSKFWVQTIVNSEMKQKLDKELGCGAIDWISPLKDREYEEYSLNQPQVRERLGLQSADFSFWTHRQPQWDAIGKAGDTLILVEAKAHASETASQLSASSEGSVDLIKRSLREAFDAYSAGGNFESWVESYYQFANRLTFLYFLKKQDIPVVLVFLNLVDDPTYLATDRKTWEAENEKILRELLEKKPLPADARVVCFDV